MAISAGIGVLIGLGLGAGITAFLMQRIIRRQDNALKQSFDRLSRIQEDHAQELNEALAKMEADYEQQLAAKIELYQDSHEAQLTELEAEYEARLAALTDVVTEVADEPAAEPELTEPADDTGAEFKPIPDPWSEAGEPPAVTDRPADSAIAVADMPTTPVPQPVDSVPPRSSAEDKEPAIAAATLGKAAAVNRKAAIRAIPQLGKLAKDSDPDVRLAAVTALQESGSIKAIPFLRQALRDTDSRIVAVASAALSRFKGAKKPAKKTKVSKKQRRR